MKKLLIILIIGLILISGCEKEVVCNKPYIQVGTECCLDSNDNSICDKDETVEEERSILETQKKTMSKEDLKKEAVKSALIAKGYIVNEVVISRSVKDGFYVGVRMKFDGKWTNLLCNMVTNGYLALYKEFPNEETYEVALDDEDRKHKRYYFQVDNRDLRIFRNIIEEEKKEKRLEEEIWDMKETYDYCKPWWGQLFANYYIADIEA